MICGVHISSALHYNKFSVFVKGGIDSTKWKLGRSLSGPGDAIVDAILSLEWVECETTQ